MSSEPLDHKTSERMPTAADQRQQDVWAKPISQLSVKQVPDGAVSLNVEGRHVVGPLQGFGQLWQKTYRIALPDADMSPSNVIREWKALLPSLMPAESRFYPSLTGIQPGEVVLINATVPGLPGGIPISTGVLVLFADHESFAVMTPEGHPESGFNTFSAYKERDFTIAQIQSLARANDPVYEAGFRFLGGSEQQERIWHIVLTRLANHFGVSASVQMRKICIDSRLQWSQVKNIRHNALLRTLVSLPIRRIRRLIG